MTNSTSIQMGVQKMIAVILLCGSLTVTVFETDRYFPFSTYPMYAVRSRPEFRSHSIRAVFKYNDGREEERLIESRLIAPFWMHSLREALFADYSDQNFSKKLNATLHWYANRLAAEHATAAESLKGLRVYVHNFPWSTLAETNSERSEVKKVLEQNSVLFAEATR